jgi:predicted hydrocarbon binding protein
MFDLIKRYVAERYMQFKDGQIWFGKEGVVFYFTPHLTTEFDFNYKTLGLEYCANMFLAGRKQGQIFVKQHGIPLMKSLTPVVKISCEILNTFGFGTFRTIKVDDKNGFMVLTGKSTLASNIKSNKPSKIPIDFMLGGLFAGASQQYLKKPMYAVETSCVAQKESQECVWIIGSEENILHYVKKFSPDKIEWTNQIISKIKDSEKKLGEQL